MYSPSGKLSRVKRSKSENEQQTTVSCVTLIVNNSYYSCGQLLPFCCVLGVMHVHVFVDLCC